MIPSLLGAGRITSGSREGEEGSRSAGSVGWVCAGFSSGVWALSELWRSNSNALAQCPWHSASHPWAQTPLSFLGAGAPAQLPSAWRGALLGKLWVLGCACPEFGPREHLQAPPAPLHSPQPALGALPWSTAVLSSVPPSLQTPGWGPAHLPGERALLTRTKGRVCQPSLR